MYSSTLFQAPQSFGAVRESLEEMTLHFTYLLRLKSEMLYEHAVRGSNFAGATALHMRLPSAEATLIRYAGFFCDIGLLMIPNKVLDHYPYLSTREWQIYKKHPEYGCSMLESHPAAQDILPYIRAHHEKWDGTGYPKHLKSVNIPLGARILSVADYYDENIYSQPDFRLKGKAEVSREVFAKNGTHFDPEVAVAFLHMLFK